MVGTVEIRLRANVSRYDIFSGCSTLNLHSELLLFVRDTNNLIDAGVLKVVIVQYALNILYMTSDLVRRSACVTALTTCGK